MDEKKEKIRKLLAEAAPQEAVGNVVTIYGNNGVAAGRDVHITHINKREVVRPVIVRGPDKISPSQAAKIKALIDRAVDRDAKAGVLDGDTARLYKKWWKILKDHFAVPSYLEISAELGDEAVAWLRQRIAAGRSRLRRPANETWRNDLYKGIWARSKELGMSKGEVYALVAERLKKRVTSLKNLGERDLKSLYNSILNKKRP